MRAARAAVARCERAAARDARVRAAVAEREEARARDDVALERARALAAATGYPGATRDAHPAGGTIQRNNASLPSCVASGAPLPSCVASGASCGVALCASCGAEVGGGVVVPAYAGWGGTPCGAGLGGVVSGIRTAGDPGGGRRGEVEPRWCWYAEARRLARDLGLVRRWEAREDALRMRVGYERRYVRKRKRR